MTIKRLFCGFCLFMLVVGAFALPVFQPVTELDVHQVDWHLDPVFQEDEAVLRFKLEQYIQQANEVLAKKTIHRFKMGNILFTTQDQYDHSQRHPPIRKGFPYWMQVLRSQTGVSGNGGRSSDSVSDASVCARTRWAKIYNYAELKDDTDELRDFHIQLYVMLHEWPHTFGVAVGEYYSINLRDDYSHVEPYQPMIIFDLNDPYWSQHRDFYHDPMCTFQYGSSLIGFPVTKQAVMDSINYTDLSALIMNEGYCVYQDWAPIGDHEHITIRVKTAAGKPAKRARIRIFNKVGHEVMEDRLDNRGELRYYNWDGKNWMTALTDNARLIKVEHNGEVTAAWMTIWELQEDYLVNGNEKFIKEIQFNKPR